MFAIIDIETTGGKFNEEGITEIAIYKYDGHEVVDQFISLVNPEREIQEFVVKLTGIDSKMLRNAPKFHEIAKRVVEITDGCVLVAHNAEFDYRILRTEFNRLGFDYKRNTICTVQLSKKLITNQASYNLGKLSKSLGIPLSNRHRASGDALATVQLFKLLLEKDTHKTIVEDAVKYHDRRKRKQKLKKLIAETPTDSGVFYIHDSDGKVIYLGKGKNLRSEITKLFLKTTKRALKIQERVNSISFNKTGNELFTRLKYYLELAALTPKYNFKKKINTARITDFSNDNFLIIDKGRAVEEHALILVENNQVFGYGYSNLAYQENTIGVLKALLTPIEEPQIAKKIVKNYLDRNQVQKIVRL